MTTLFKKLSLADQTALHLKKEIHRGTWHHWLPDERALSRSLGVSRTTLRNALNQLKLEGYLESQNSRGNRLNPKFTAMSGNSKKQSHEVTVEGDKATQALTTPKAESSWKCAVNFLCPANLDNDRHFLIYLIERMREYFYRNETNFNVIQSTGCYTSNPGRFIDKIVNTNPANSWIIFRARKSLQQWLWENQVPCTLVGSAFDEFDLPNVDVDYEATCRHAANGMIRLGHRSIIYLMEETERAGDICSRNGFLNALKSSPEAMNGEVIKYHDNPHLLIKLKGLLDRPSPPTALLIDEPDQFLLALTFLSHQGVHIPDDISLVCRKDMPEFTNVIPEPTRYSSHSKTFAKKVFRQALHNLKRHSNLEQNVRIFPDYIPGKSLAPPQG